MRMMIVICAYLCRIRQCQLASNEQSDGAMRFAHSWAGASHDPAVARRRTGAARVRRYPVERQPRLCASSARSRRLVATSCRIAPGDDGELVSVAEFIRRMRPAGAHLLVIARRSAPHSGSRWHSIAAAGPRSSAISAATTRCLSRPIRQSTRKSSSRKSSASRSLITLPGVNPSEQRPVPIILAFSGGLDTSFCVPWLKETYGRDVITATVDTGGIDAAAASALEERAMRSGRSSTC